MALMGYLGTQSVELPWRRRVIPPISPLISPLISRDRMREPLVLFAEPPGLLIIGHIGAELYGLREIQLGQRRRILAAAFRAAQQRWQRHCLRLQDALHLLGR